MSAPKPIKQPVLDKPAEPKQHNKPPFSKFDNAKRVGLSRSERSQAQPSRRKKVPKVVVDSIKEELNELSHEELREVLDYMRQLDRRKYPEEPPIEAKVSYHRKRNGYWYCTYREEGRVKTKYVGSQLPKGLDPSKVSISGLEEENNSRGRG